MTVSIQIPGAPPILQGACRVIAEAGANHNNSVDRAIELASRAADAGAWAIKFQLYKAGSLVIEDSPKYWTDSVGTSTQYEAFALSDRLGYDEYDTVASYCTGRGIVFFATPFDLAAVEALERVRTPLYKIASGDLTNKSLIEATASTGKPILMSTGAADLHEIEDAIRWTGYGPDRLVLLVCTLTYPTPDEDGHFARIEEFRRHFDPYMIGMSDHTLGPEGGWIASALGAVCIEKHYTLDKSLPDVPDHAMSVDPRELTTLVGACDRGACLRGEDWIGVRESERPARDYARRSIVLAVDVPAGERLESDHLDFKRPGTGIPPFRAAELIGRRARRLLREDTLLQEEDLDG